MEKLEKQVQSAQEIAVPFEQKSTPKLPYEPPAASFVPLTLEERILACGYQKCYQNSNCAYYNHG